MRSRMPLMLTFKLGGGQTQKMSMHQLTKNLDSNSRLLRLIESSQHAKEGQADVEVDVS